MIRPFDRRLKSRLNAEGEVVGRVEAQPDQVVTKRIRSADVLVRRAAICVRRQGEPCTEEVRGGQMPGLALSNSCKSATALTPPAAAFAG